MHFAMAIFHLEHSVLDTVLLEEYLQNKVYPEKEIRMASSSYKKGMKKLGKIRLKKRILGQMWLIALTHI